MFNFAWSELALIAAVALIVIGPKDLPRVLRTCGQWVRKARAIAREFQGSLEEMVRDADLDDVKRHVESATRFNFEEEFAKTVDPQGEIKRSLSEPVLSNPLADAPASAAAGEEEAKRETPTPAAPAEATPSAAPADVAPPASPAEPPPRAASGGAP